MATRLYFSRKNHPATTPTADASWEQSNSNRYRLTQTKFSDETLANVSITKNAATNPMDLMVASFVSPPLVAQSLSNTGTLKAVIAVFENSSALDATAQILVKVVANDLSTVRGTFLPHQAASLGAQEFNTGGANQKTRFFPDSTTSPTYSTVAAQDGDRIVVEVGCRARETASGSIAQFEFGAPIATSDFSGATESTENSGSGVSWIEFTQDIQFIDESAPSKFPADNIDPPAADRDENQVFGTSLHLTSLGAQQSLLETGPTSQLYRSYFGPIGTRDDKGFNSQAWHTGGGSVNVTGGGGDSTSPLITSVTPTVGGSITRTQVLGFTVTDNSGNFRRIVILAKMGTGSSALWEVVYDGSDVAAGYSLDTTPTVGGTVFSNISRTVGWPKPELTLYVFAIDAAGNEASPTTYSWTVTNPDTTAPTITNFSPAQNSVIGNTTNVGFDTEDAVHGQTTVEVKRFFTDGTSETVYNGTAFVSPYNGAGSSRGGTNNKTFVIERTGGWSTGPTSSPVVLAITSIDGNGNRAVATYELMLSGQLGTDLSPPIISTGPTPSPGSISRTQAIAFDLVDDGTYVSGIEVANIAVHYASGKRQPVWDAAVDDEFASPFDASSTVTPITNGYSFSINPGVGGWLESSFTIKVHATDSHGNAMATQSFAYTVSNADLTGPTFDTFSPARGGSVALAGAVSFKAYDTAGSGAQLPAGQPVIKSVLPDGTVETVYNGTAFVAPYSASSTRTGTNQENFSIVRTGNWVFPQVTLELVAKDASGNQSTDLYEVDVANTAPTINNFVPADASTIAATDTVTVDVTDPDSGGAFSKIVVLAAYSPSGVVQTVHDGVSFRGTYTGSVTNITNGKQYSISKTGGFHAGMTIQVIAVDAAGGASTGQATYTVSNPTPISGGDVTPPTVGSFSPAPGSAISAATSVSFQVLDNSGNFRRIFVVARFDRTGVEELVHDGTEFKGYYGGGASSRTPIANGFQYSVLRYGGWPSAPTIRAYAIDLDGNEGNG